MTRRRAGEHGLADEVVGRLRAAFEPAADAWAGDENLWVARTIGSVPRTITHAEPARTRAPYGVSMATRNDVNHRCGSAD